MDIVIVLITVALAPVISLAIRLLRPEWLPFKISGISSAILPGIMVALWVVLFASAATAGKERCGVDACGMAMMAATHGGAAAIGLFLIGWPITYCFQRWLARR